MSPAVLHITTCRGCLVWPGNAPTISLHHTHFYILLHAQEGIIVMGVWCGRWNTYNATSHETYTPYHLHMKVLQWQVYDVARHYTFIARWQTAPHATTYTRSSHSPRWFTFTATVPHLSSFTSIPVWESTTVKGDAGLTQHYYTGRHYSQRCLTWPDDAHTMLHHLPSYTSLSG